MAYNDNEHREQHFCYWVKDVLLKLQLLVKVTINIFDSFTHSVAQNLL
jgi:hypothetical protein